MTQEDLLFLDAVSAGIHGAHVRWEPLPEQVWTSLFRLAETQKLLPILVDAVCECPNAETDASFPARRSAARRQVVFQARRDAAFFPLYAQLREAGIDALVVKGGLCRSVYPNGALRISADEDLLTDDRGFPEACRLLAAAGLTADAGADPLRSEEIGWRSPDCLLYIELHRSLFEPDSGPFGLLQSVFTDVFARVQTYSLADGTSVLSLSPHDHLLYLLLHAMKHFIRTGFGLRQVCDIGLWAARWQEEIDWALLRRQAEQVHGARFCAAVFRIAAEHLGIAQELPAFWTEDAPDPEPMLRDLLAGGVYGASSQSRAHTARITQDAVAAQRAGKRRSLRTALFPAASTLEADYPVLKEHPAMLPLIWEKRLIRYLKHAGTQRTDSPAEALRLGRERLALLRQYGILDAE